jgi:hypothetical protein
MQSGFRAGVLAVLFAVAAGCESGSGDKPIPIQGKVSFQGQPVAEGSVQFNDEKTGRGAEVKLDPNGTYQAALPAGTYAVVVLPPLVEAKVKNQDTPPDTVFKKVKNIPVKYHSTATSGLTAAVAADKTTHDFDLKP